jgi:hypothetical protein
MNTTQGDTMNVETRPAGGASGDSGERPVEPAGQGGTSRRRGIGAGLKLAAIAPAVLVALPLGTAAADDDSDRRGRGRGRDDGRIDDMLERLREREAELRRRLEDRRDDRPIGGGQGLRLLKMSDADGNDIDKGNAAGSQDRLDQGVVRVARESGDASGRVTVALVRAQANAVYEVFFLRMKGGRDRIGQLTTNGEGNFGGLVRSGSNNTGDPGRLGGNNRIGIFILTRDGKDQFVSGYRTQPST